MAFGFETTGNEVVDMFNEHVAGKTFLITGPTPGGIGAETAISLIHAKPKHLILAGRSQSKIQPLIDDLNRRYPETRVSFLPLDLSSQKSIRAAADGVEPLLAGTKIDVLILNAAIMACPYALTEDGIESQFGTNYIGHFLFTNLLLQQGLVKSRIVVVSSSASERSADYIFAPLKDITFDEGKSYDPIVAYSFSKGSGVLYAKRLARLLKPRNIAVFSLNPGSIKTNLQVHMTEEMRNAAIEQAQRENPDFQAPQRKTLQEGVATQLRAGLDPSLVENSGAYLDNCQVKRLRQHVDAEVFEDQLWALSEQLVGEKFDF